MTPGSQTQGPTKHINDWLASTCNNSLLVSLTDRSETQAVSESRTSKSIPIYADRIQSRAEHSRIGMHMHSKMFNFDASQCHVPNIPESILCT